MVCEICHKNEANVHITKIINGQKKEMHICEKCAKQVEGVNINSDMQFISPFSFQNILSGLMDYMGTSYPDVKSTEIRCENCGTTYNEFKQKGLLGCSECYKSFASMIEPVINRVQGNVNHIGKIPKKSGYQIIERKKIDELTEKLKKAIDDEEYEKAAVYRDQIRKLQNAEGDEK
ncbi:UvrB/UvrC motif-containing protein [Clostridium hydrogenum]|uniref:UvrB/UvrC motif-containing protein n=1 Tax=Clostridium hydrogenum TaxID=2855764 RepID=UPI001F24C79B|nr:UvrB/UvrC motif-containing protein [Clostridium hydrogenum]